MFLDTNMVVDALRRFPPAVIYLERLFAIIEAKL